jgi:hypothetical protein
MRGGLAALPGFAALGLGAGPARADEVAVLAATEADEVNEEHCGRLHDARTGGMTESQVVVSQVWSRVSDV